MVVHLFQAHQSAPQRRFVESGVSEHTSGNPFDVEVKPSALAGKGRIYLVQLGGRRLPYDLDVLAAWLRTSYSLDVQVLPEVPLEPAAYDKDRRQYISQLLNDQILRSFAARNIGQDAGRDANANAGADATILGVTDADMYSIAKGWDASFTQRDAAHRVAIISADCFSEGLVSSLKTKPGAYAAALENALQRILLRDLAVLYWHLPLNNDEASVLAPTLDVSVPSHALYQSELRPERTQWGMYVTEPCITFTYRNGSGDLKAPAGNMISECGTVEDGSHDEQQERFQIQISYGLLTVRHTDFYQPGGIPIELERATSSWWKDNSRAFGRSGSHNYDRYLATWDNMRHISVVSTGSESEPLVRIPEGLPILLFNRWVDQDGSGKMAELRWHPGPQERFDLTRYTGDVETYLPCDDRSVCYLNGLRSAHGEDLRFERDGDRSLVRLTGPNQHWLEFRYGPEKRIAGISDNRGRKVEYRYDERGYLAGVRYPTGERLEYGYNDQGDMIRFSAAPDATTPMRVLLRIEYEHGRISRQTLADGTVFEYRYKGSTTSEPATVASIRKPDGTILDFAMSSEMGSAVRERLRP